MNQHGVSCRAGGPVITGSISECGGCCLPGMGIANAEHLGCFCVRRKNLIPEHRRASTLHGSFKTQSTAHTAVTRCVNTDGDISRELA